MKLFFISLLFLILNNCSLNNNSKFWTEDVEKKVIIKNELNKILIKSNNLMSLTFNEYMIFINEYDKKSNYPDLNR